MSASIDSTHDHVHATTGSCTQKTAKRKINKVEEKEEEVTEMRRALEEDAAIIKAAKERKLRLDEEKKKRDANFARWVEIAKKAAQERAEEKARKKKEGEETAIRDLEATLDAIFDTEEEKTETWPPKDEEAATVEIGRPAAAAPPDWEETLLTKNEDLCKRIEERQSKAKECAKQLDGLDEGLQRLQTSLSTTSAKIDAARSMAAAAFAAAEAALASARND